GMCMIGQAAALCGQTKTIQTLHEQVSIGATTRLADVANPFARASAVTDDQVAIIGIECVFPGAPDRHAYWANIVRGADSVTDVPRERWDPDIYFDSKVASGKTNSK